MRRLMRYVASGSETIIEVNPCLTTLLFPFVTNQLHVQHRTGHHECFGGIRVLHHRLQRCQCS